MRHIPEFYQKGSLVPEHWFKLTPKNENADLSGTITFGADAYITADSSYRVLKVQEELSHDDAAIKIKGMKHCDITFTPKLHIDTINLPRGVYLVRSACSAEDSIKKPSLIEKAKS